MTIHNLFVGLRPEAPNLPGKVELHGEKLDLGRIWHDVYAVGAEKDHIVPWQNVRAPSAFFRLRGKQISLHTQA